MGINIQDISVISVASALLSVGGFYYLTNFRIQRLEKEIEKMQDINERLIRIETMLNEMRTNSKRQ